MNGNRLALFASLAAAQATTEPPRAEASKLVERERNASDVSYDLQYTATTRIYPDLSGCTAIRHVVDALEAALDEAAPNWEGSAYSRNNITTQAEIICGQLGIDYTPDELEYFDNEQLVNHHNVFPADGIAEIVS